MDSKYSGFLEANPTFQERVEAFTSGLMKLSPRQLEVEKKAMATPA